MIEKRIISFCLSLVMLVSIIQGIAVFADNAELFEYTLDSETKTASIVNLKSNYKDYIIDKTSKEFTMPKTYVNNGITYTVNLNSGMGLFRYDANNDYDMYYYKNDFDKITFPNNYNMILSRMFQDSSIKEVVFEYKGSEFQINARAFLNCAAIEKIEIHAEAISGTPSANVFSGINESCKIYVKNANVKASLSNYPYQDNIIIVPTLGDDISVDKTALSNKITEVETFLSGIDKSKYNNVAALETAIAHAKTVNENASATQTEVDNEVTALTSALNNVYPVADKTALSSKITEAETFLSGIDKSKYNNVAALETAIAHAKTVNENALATQTEVDNEVTALTSALGNVKLTDKTKLANMIGVYEKFIGEIDKTTYTNVEAFETALAHAKTVYNSDTATQEEVDKELDDLMTARGNMKPIVDKTALKEAIDKAEAFKEGKLESDYDNYKNFTDVIVTAKMYYESDRYTQEQLDGVKDRLIAAQEKVTKADASEEKAQLDALIEQAEALESDMFTEESWTPVETALTEAKAIDDGLKSEYNAVIEKLNTALKGLVGIELPTVPAGKPFAKVYKKGRTATVINTTADKDMAKATKIRVTFDCAEDVSYNPNASIEIKAMVGGIESYKKFIGKDSSYKNGETWTEELTLTEAINEGDSVELSAFTYAWDNAKDYVYGITKVEFLNIGGSVVKSYNDQIVAVAELKTAIEKAEAIDITPYTAESVAELTKAIEAAKALTDESTADELNSAINAINTAIKNLKESVPTEPNPTKPNPIKQEPSNPIEKPTAKPTTASTKVTRSSEAVAKDKKAAQKIMKQAKIKKLTTKSKSKKKITVSWKKVKKAVGYQVQVSTKKNFKKVISDKLTAKTKLNIKNKKLKSGKKYYVRVRAYATYKDKNNVTQKVYSRWNKKIRKVTVK